MAADNLRQVEINHRGRIRHVLEYGWPGQRIWGATAAILYNLRRWRPVPCWAHPGCGLRRSQSRPVRPIARGPWSPSAAGQRRLRREAGPMGHWSGYPGGGLRRQRRQHGRRAAVVVAAPARPWPGGGARRRHRRLAGCRPSAGNGGGGGNSAAGLSGAFR
ncbi:hypothetical protein G6F59_014847 [Rhizopus arrhizus]|nr:hypothetical protein G6F59_014847 [Rhizopus arrhizus]